MGTRQDFAQKLLNDLRLRKERMAAAQNSDAYRRSSRQTFQGSRETRTLDTVGAKTGSGYKSSSTSQRSLSTSQAANHIVPFGGGHHSGHLGDLSMALEYAFDNKGKLKRFELKSSSKMVDFLQQIGRRSMQQSSNMQWQLANQFPTLTHLHIDEIAKGAQKLNKILRACSKGLDIDTGSIEVGKELWKGAMELEQSLRMLVSLQEASDSVTTPHRKSRLKLLEDDEDNEDVSSTNIEKQKQVKRPIFSFDKLSKSNKGKAQTGLQQNLLALTYLKEEPYASSEKKGSMTPKSISHRRSTSCVPDFQIAQQTNSSQSKHNKARLPNVIAKLMGLEELPENVNGKAAAESRTFSKPISGELVATDTAYGSSRSAEFRDEHTKHVQVQVNHNRVESNNNIDIRTSHKLALQEGKAHCTHDYSHKATPNLQKPRWNEKEREGIRNPVRESQEAIYKINELQSQILQLNQNARNQGDIKQEVRVNGIHQKQQEVKNVMETFHETEKRLANELPLHQQKQKSNNQMQQIEMLVDEPQGKKLRADNRNQQMANNKVEVRIREDPARKSESSRALANNFKSVRKNPAKQENTRKKNADGKKLKTSKAFSTSSQKNYSATDNSSINSEAKVNDSLSLNSEQDVPTTDQAPGSQVCRTSNEDSDHAHGSVKKMGGDLKPLRKCPTVRANEAVAKKVKTCTMTIRAQKPHKPTGNRLKQKKLDKFTVQGATSPPNEAMPKCTKITQANAVPSMQVKHEEFQEADTEQIGTRDHPVRVELQSQQEAPPSNRNENTASTVYADQQGQEPVPGEFPKVKSQGIESDSYKDQTTAYCEVREEKKPTIEKQEPLTEDEIHLKQKLIISHLFLNTAEALFKLDIPIGILNYASEQICQDKESKLILDCGYELLKRKGRRKEMSVSPHINKLVSCTRVRSLDELMKQLHKDFETLRFYGRDGKHVYDDAEYLLRMLERDIFYKDPEVNCMWDLGWNRMMFAYAELDEVIRDVEQDIVNELVLEIVEDCL